MEWLWQWADIGESYFIDFYDAQGLSEQAITDLFVAALEAIGS